MRKQLAEGGHRKIRHVYTLIGMHFGVSVGGGLMTAETGDPSFAIISAIFGGVAVWVYFRARSIGLADSEVSDRE